MNKKYEITGSLQSVKKSKYYQAVINVPIGIKNKTKPKWISTNESNELKATRVMLKIIDEFEIVLNNDYLSIEEKLSKIFISKKDKYKKSLVIEGDNIKIVKVAQPVEVEDKSESNIIIKNRKKTYEELAKMNPDNIMLIDLLHIWKYAFSDVEVDTLDGIEYNFQHIIPYFEKQNLRLKDVKTKHIQLFVNDQGMNGRLDGKGGVVKKSVKEYISSLRKVFKFAKQQDWIEINPVNDITYSVEIFPRRETESLHLELPDLIKLLKYVLNPQRFKNPTEHTWGYAAAIIFAAFYALRRSEIFGIRWCDIDWEKDIVRIENVIVRVNKLLEKKPKSKASRAPMPLLPIVKSFLFQLKEYQKKCAEFYGDTFTDNDYICCRKADGSRFGLNYVNITLQQDLKTLKIEPIINQHGLRHSAATLLRTLGLEDNQVQSWLRHADIQMTLHYAHDNIKVKEFAGQTMNDVFKIEYIPYEELVQRSVNS